MSKLVSLKEKPATYCCCNCGSIEQVIIGYEAKQGGDEKQIRCGNCHRYSSFNNEDKPIGFIMVKLISEQEYNELKQGQIKGRCKDCKHTEYCDWLASDGYGYCSEFEPKAEKSCDNCDKFNNCGDTGFPACDDWTPKADKVEGYI